MMRDEGAAVMKITQEQSDTLRKKEEHAKETYGNYVCPYCNKYIWWDEPHAHKVGAIVRTK